MGPVTIGASSPYSVARPTPNEMATAVLTIPLSGCAIDANNEFSNMLRTRIEPKMNGTVTRVRKIIGSVAITPTPIYIASAVTATVTIVQTIPSTGCFISPGDAVNGQRSKQSTRNIAATCVTQKTSAWIAMCRPLGADAR